MEYRQLGTSDIRVSAVTLGTQAIGGWLWGGTDDDNAVAAIGAAIDAGMTSIDTAPIYGFGHSETIVGRAVAGRRDEVQLLTKFDLRWDCQEGEHFFDSTDNDGDAVSIYRNAKADSIVAECEASLRRLGTDYIDLYQCHWRDHTTPVEETMEAVDKLIQSGKIRAAGVSNFSIEEIDAAREVVPLASNQPPYSMLRRGIEKDLLPYCLTNQIGVIVYSTLQYGILSGKVTMDREFPKSDQRSGSPHYRPENRRKVLDFVDRLRPVADAHDATIAQVVIHWTIRRPGITAALVGARNAQQARENAAAAELALSDEEMRRIDAWVDALELDL